MANVNDNKGGATRPAKESEDRTAKSAPQSEGSRTEEEAREARETARE